MNLDRNQTVDIMKGVGILAVIAGHSLPSDCLGNQVIHSFHMPLFFIVAGYFYKPNAHYCNKLDNDFRRLLVPYLVIAAGFSLYLLAKENNSISALKYSFIATIFGSAWHHYSLIWGKAPHIGVAWFLPALFCCRQIFNLVYNNNKNAVYIIIVMAISAAAIDRYLINLPFALLPGLSAMIFYLIGYYAKLTHINRHSLMFIGIIGTLCWLLHLRYSKLDMCNCTYGLYPLDVVAASFATGMVYYGSKHLPNTYIGKMLSYIGKFSLYIYCVHALENVIKPYEWISLEALWYLEFPIRGTWCILIAYTYLKIKAYIFKIFG